MDLKNGGVFTLNKTVTRATLAEAAAARTGLHKADIVPFVDSMFTHMAAALMKGENVKLTAFGSFQVRKRAERLGRNPRTGEEHRISPRHTVVFTPSAQLREALDAADVTQEQVDS
ncbi:MAG: HU family DNA-binding protein [Alphaproteobacteria bacterium]|jgi:integration host factor subunit alpha|nr:HU family DNA-binding protein [Alphaproteobacteria bacterium]